MLVNLGREDEIGKIMMPKKSRQSSGKEKAALFFEEVVV